MFSLSTLTKRLLGGAKPVVVSQVMDTVTHDEWTSLDLDPELGRFGSPAIVVKQDAAAALRVAEPDVAAVAEAAVESSVDVAPLLEPSARAEPVTLSLQLMSEEELTDEEPAIPLDQPQEAGPQTLPATDVVAPEAAAPAETAAAPKKTKAKKAAPKKSAPKAASKAKKASKSKAAGASAPRRPTFSSFQKGGWQLPGVNGFFGVSLDDSVETVKLDFALQTESADQ